MSTPAAPPFCRILVAICLCALASPACDDDPSTRSDTTAADTGATTGADIGSDSATTVDSTDGDTTTNDDTATTSVTDAGGDASDTSAGDTGADTASDTSPADTGNPDTREDVADAMDTTSAMDGNVDAMDGTDADMSIGEPADNCKMAWGGGGGVGIGFPTPAPPRLASTGTVRATLVFVDFQDVTADRTPSEVFDILNPGASEFFDATSYGRLELVLDPHLQWLRLSGDASTYAAGLTSFQGHRDFIAEAVALADPDVDFSATDLVVVVATPNATEVGYGPTWMGNAAFAIEADGNAITNGITSGADLLFWGATWLNHEMGHSMGLPDLYEFGVDNGFTRPFSVMDLISSDAPEPLAWERWQLGWLDDAQVVCNPAPGTEVALSPIEAAGGTKSVAVRTSATRAVMVESRRALGYDDALTREGAVVTLIDASVATGSGPIRVENGQQALLQGESVTVDGVTVEVTAASAAGDTVRITR